MIHESTGPSGNVVFFISSNGCWMPGAYESVRAARYAFRLTEDERCELRDKVNRSEGNPPITFAMMQSLRKTRKAGVCK
jgi:hypothetical protein